MADDLRSAYERRIAAVLDYIAAHLSDDLSVDALCRVAGFSKYHFHRQFSAIVGDSVARVVSRVRLKQASFELAFADRRILDIALDAGFDSPETFARAFRNAQGQSPSEFRSAPAWEHWSNTFKTPAHPRSPKMTPSIVDFPETRVAVLEHHGDPASLMRSVQRFIEWRKSCDASPVASSGTFGVPYGDPETVSAEEWRFDICGEIRGEIPVNDFGVVEKRIPGGPCAMVTHRGSTDLIGPSIVAMYRDWLPESGRSLRDFPVFFHYRVRVPDVSEHEQETDIYLPLAEAVEGDGLSPSRP